MLAPFDVFSDLFHNHPRSWSVRFLGADVPVDQAGDILERFWASVSDAEPRKEAIAAAFPHVRNLWRKAVPIRVHGDGVPVTRGRASCDNVSWMGFFGEEHKP